MPTTVANFNFLAGLVSEILTGSQNQKWGLLISSDAPRGQVLYGALPIVVLSIVHL